MSAPHRLPDGSEARGLLQDINCADGCAVATFPWGAVSFPEELEHRLRELVGRETAILRLDGRYHIRTV